MVSGHFQNVHGTISADRSGHVKSNGCFKQGEMVVSLDVLLQCLPCSQTMIQHVSTGASNEVERNLTEIRRKPNRQPQTEGDDEGGSERKNILP